MSGYHLSHILPGTFGESDKILEEALEFMDAERQKVKLMALVELGDLVGAIEGWLERHAPGFIIDDLRRMAQISGRVFESGHRQARQASPLAGPAPNPVAIHWGRLSGALDWYRERGWRYVELPWLLPHAATQYTWDAGMGGMITGLGDLPGSAEQGFLAEALRGRLPEGNLIAITPCFRAEQQLSHGTRLWFMKAELFSRNMAPEEMAHLAAEGFRALGAETELVRTEDGFDLNCNGVEVGSYGRREHQGLAWTYGTAVAEPRLSHALAQGAAT